MNHRPDPADDRLRALLHDAVADVDPPHALAAIRSRTKETPMTSTRRRPWIYGAAAAAVATAATVTGVAVLGNGDTTPAAGPAPATSQQPSPDSPAGGSDPAVADPEGSAGATGSEGTSGEPGAVEGEDGGVRQMALPVYYLGETGQGPRLYREYASGAAVDPLSEALTLAVGRDPADPDYFTPWPSGTTVVGTTPVEVGAPIVVDVSGAGLRQRPDSMTVDEAEMAIQQLVHTAQAALQSTAPVQLLLDGSRTDTLLGVPAAEPLARGEAAETLAQVWIVEPASGATVPRTFTVEGVGAFFEANVTWQLLRGDRVVQDGFATAAECCTMAPYAFQVTAEPGDYTLVVADEDVSGGEGFAPFEDTKEITVR